MEARNIIYRTLNKVDWFLDSLLQTPQGLLAGLIWLLLSVAPPFLYLLGINVMDLWLIAVGINLGMIAGATATSYRPTRELVAASVLLLYTAVFVLATIALFDSSLLWIYAFIPDSTTTFGGLLWGLSLGTGLYSVWRLARFHRSVRQSHR